MSAIMRRTTVLFVLLSGALCLWVGSAGAADEFEEYELESASVELSTNQAGAHPDFTTTFALTSKVSELGEEPYAQTRDVEVKLPPGLIGNPQGVPPCSVAQFGNRPEENECPVASQIGVTVVRVGGVTHGTFLEPIYNMEPPGGETVARVGFFAVNWPTFLNVKVDPVDYSIVATIEGAPSAAGLIEAETTLWGVPAASVHDEERLTPLEALHNEFPAGGRKPGIPPAPFMTNPTDCSLSRELTVTVRSYQLPGQPSSKSAPFPKIEGCDQVGFAPTFTAVPTNPEAAAPTGLDAELVVPQNETANGKATSAVRSAVVSLPEGMTINPAAGDGLQACSSEQVGFEKPEPSHCPDAAKIGSAEVEVPALERTLNGAVYQRTPEPGHLFRFWLVTDEQGVHLKLPAEIQANALTGQVTTLFVGIPKLNGLPQVPVEAFKLHVFGGPRAPLATPPTCGTYQTHYEFTPWSGKAPTVGDTAMQITSGCNKGGFSPGLSAGMLNTTGGRFSAFALTLTRQDGEANPQSLSLTLPRGLLAKTAGVTLCSDAGAATGSCPASSQVGTVTAATGVGGAPLWVPQPGKSPTAVYLAGPYKGAPYSIVAVVPAQAGPFDLGTVVNRAALYVDPETAIATVKTDPLPQILEGVPVTYRTVHVDTSRSNFTLNPTSCDRKQIQAHVVASNGATADPAVPFQATNCARLGYSPKLKISFKGKTKRTGHPAVKAILTQPSGQANTSGATTVLPSSEFIDQNHINNPCTRVQFNANACPQGSVLGNATVTTPLLDQPLSGPIYFRSNGGERELPDVVADLHGAVHFILVGFVDSVGKKGSEVRRIRVRFLDTPDAPVSRFELNFFGGKRGLLVNSTNLCAKQRTAKLTFGAQNGKRQVTDVPIATGCNKHG
jgi:hypothetical protein